MLLYVCWQILQPDMWGVVPSDRHDWVTLRADLDRYEQYHFVLSFLLTSSAVTVEVYTLFSIFLSKQQ